MKKTRKIFAVILALVMCFAMALPAMATNAAKGNNETTQGIIIIDNAEVGQDYAIYKIFDLESYDSTADAYSYKVATEWTDFINTIGKEYVTVDKNGYVSWIKEKDTPADAAEFAKKAIAYAKDSTDISPTSGPTTATGATVEFKGLDLGYYLVDSTVGALCNLTTTNNKATIQDKNVKPTTEKEVQEDSTENWGDQNDAELGELVTYRATIHAKKGAENYIFHDVMQGLTFVNVSKIQMGETTLNLGEDKDYTVIGSADTKDDCSFEVVFTQKFLDTITQDADIIIEYTATVNPDAIIRGNGNPNEEWLTYGDKNEATERDKTTTFVWDFDVFKYTNGEEDAKTPLAGAVFSLSTTEDVADALKFVNDGENSYKLDAKEGTVTSFTTDATGKFNLKGLDSGTYYLIETEAPDGYNKLDGPVKVTIDEDGKITYDETALEEGNTEVQVLNNAGSLLPSTGGIGTTIFYVIGICLVAGAVVILVTRKRASRNS